MSWFNRLPKALPPFEANQALVLPANGPKHYHVQGVTYTGLMRDGMTLSWSAAFDLIGNDVMAVAEQARQTAHAPRVHVKNFRVCSEKH